MPLLRPPLQKIRARSTSDFEFELGSQAARVSGTPERGFVQALAGASHGMHGQLAWIAKNAFAHSAEDAQMERWAAFFGVFKLPAERATGEVYFFGTNGTVVPAGTTATRDDGVQFESTEEVTIAGGNATAAARCVIGGTTGNVETGTELTLDTPLAGLQSNVEVKTPGFTGGTDEETSAALRTRLLERLDNPPSGGGPGSYIAWAKEVSGVTRVWEYGKVPSLGWVTVLFVRDNDTNMGLPDPIPGAGEIAAVEAKLLEYAPLHLAGLVVQAPIAKALSLTIHISPDNTANRAAVGAAIQAMLAAEAEPAPADGTTFYRSKIVAAIASVGLDDFDLSVPAADLSLLQWELPMLNDVATITWI